MLEKSSNLHIKFPHRGKRAEKIVETKICKKCSSEFEITNKDLEFYKKISPKFDGEIYEIPAPTLCPDCRQQRRQSFKNIYHLYKNDKKGFISAFSPDKGLNVILQKDWWNDSDLGLEFGRDYDFDKNFFEQFAELQRVGPRWNLIQVGCENCEWSINISSSKDCYLVKSGGNIENCYYGERIFSSKDIVDGFRVNNSTNCYDCLNVINSFKIFFGINISNSSDSLYVKDCENIKNCIGCVGIKDKENFILNIPSTIDEVKNIKNKILLDKKFREDFFKKYKKLIIETPVKSINNMNCENCVGNEIYNSSNVFYGFDVNDAENGKYVFDGVKGKNKMDVNGDDSGTLSYENCSIYKVYSSAFCFNSLELNNCYYCDTCAYLKNCFGCVGLNNKSYCILNRQYTKEEYEKLIPQIISHMMTSHQLYPSRGEGGEKEWGEFFSFLNSPYGYNESEAFEYNPLKKEEAIKQGFKWSNYESPLTNVEKIIPANKLPENIKDIPDDILNWAIKCEITKKPFKIISQELEFYRKNNLPIPTRHPDRRHLDRISQRNQRKLYERKCDKCGKQMQTTYSPDREEIVYCEKCYNKEVSLSKKGSATLI